MSVCQMSNHMIKESHVGIWVLGYSNSNWLTPFDIVGYVLYMYLLQLSLKYLLVILQPSHGCLDR